MVSFGRSIDSLGRAGIQSGFPIKAVATVSSPGDSRGKHIKMTIIYRSGVPQTHKHSRPAVNLYLTELLVKMQHIPFLSA